MITKIKTKIKDRIEMPAMRNLLKYLLIFFAIMFLLFVFISKRMFVFLAISLAITTLVALMMRTLRRTPIGLEFVMFPTVLSGFAYGPVAGAVMGGLCILIDDIISAKISPYSLTYIPMYMLAGFFASFFSGSSIALIGITTVIAYNAVGAAVWSAMGARPYRTLIFSTTNIFFNIILFTKVAPLALQLIR